MKRALLLLSLAACTPSLPPDRGVSVGDKRSNPDIMEVPARGFPVEVVHNDSQETNGELIAVDRCFVYVLKEDETTIAIASDSVKRATVSAYSSKAGLYALWTTAGVLSTPSHGYFAVFTAPVWLGVGIPTSVIIGGKNDVHTKPADAKLFQYARFPQGKPPAWPVKGTIGTAPPDCFTAPTQPPPAQPPPPEPPAPEPPASAPPIGG